MFKAKTLSSILSTFNKTLKELEGLSSHNRTISDVKALEAKKLHEESVALLEEASKADAVAENIRKIIGG